MNESEFVLGGDELRNIKIKKTHEQPFKKAPVTNRQGLSNIKWHIYAKVKNDAEVCRAYGELKYIGYAC